MSRSDALPAAARAVVTASLRLLVRADDAAVRAVETRDRLRTAVAVPLPRRPYDDV